MFRLLYQLYSAEDGNPLAEFSLFVGFLVIAGAGFFCFSANQFRDVFQSSYQLK